MSKNSQSPSEKYSSASAEPKEISNDQAKDQQKPMQFQDNQNINEVLESSDPEPIRERDEVRQYQDHGEGKPSQQDHSIPALEELNELRTKATERDEFLKDLQRARADYQNLQRRMERDRGNWTNRALQPFAADLLPVLDQLDMAIESGNAHQDLKSFLEGIHLVYSTFLGVLRKFKIEPILTENQPFDPTFHEAILQEESAEYPDLTIIQEIRKGYKMDDKVIRPSQVKVSRAPGELGGSSETSNPSSKSEDMGES